MRLSASLAASLAHWVVVGWWAGGCSRCRYPCTCTTYCGLRRGRRAAELLLALLLLFFFFYRSEAHPSLLFPLSLSLSLSLTHSVTRSLTSTVQFGYWEPIFWNRPFSLLRQNGAVFQNKLPNNIFLLLGPFCRLTLCWFVRFTVGLSVCLSLGLRYCGIRTDDVLVDAVLKEAAVAANTTNTTTWRWLWLWCAESKSKLDSEWGAGAWRRRRRLRRCGRS